MAKKKINIKSVSNDVESGDVNISYKNVRIAGLSETTTAVLETKDTICEDDIEVEYTKSAGGGLLLPKLNFTSTVEGVTISSIKFSGMSTLNGAVVCAIDGTNIVIPERAQNAQYYLIPQYTRDGYYFGIYIESAADNLRVVVNDRELVYNALSNSYRYEYTEYSTYPGDITITVDAKSE